MYDLMQKRFFWMIGILIFLKLGAGLSIFQSRVYKEKGYEVVVPKGWMHSKKLSAEFKTEGSVYETRLATFVLEKQKKLPEDELDAKLQIYSRKLESAMWIEDEMPEIIAYLKRAGMKVIDKGELKIGGGNDIAQWVFFQNRAARQLIIEFYVITDLNMFYKLQYTSKDRLFNKYRPDFERFKNSFTIRYSLW